MLKSKLLATLPVFSSLSPEELKDIAVKWTSIEIAKDEIIFKKGDPANTIYIIQEGTVSITLPTFSGNDLILSLLKQGEMFGELTLFDLNERTANAIAVENTKLLKMSRDLFIDLMKKYPDIAIQMLIILTERLRNTNIILERQVTRNANDEIASEITFADRIADKLSQFIGSWTFLIFFVCTLTGWIVINTYNILYHPIDVYPFVLLNLLLSCLAAMQAPIIMMSQGRQSKKDHIAADLDYRINLKSELQIEEILARIDGIRREEVLKLKEHSTFNAEMTQLKNQMTELQSNMAELLHRLHQP